MVRITRKLVWGVALTSLILAYAFGVLFTFARQDMAKLEKFTSAYQSFDAAISDQNLSDASDALGQLKSAAEQGLSSATKNDVRLMQAEHEIADVCAQELGRLKAYKIAVPNPSADGDAFGASLREITTQRMAAYVHFRELLN